MDFFLGLQLTLKGKLREVDWETMVGRLKVEILIIILFYSIFIIIIKVEILKRTFCGDFI